MFREMSFVALTAGLLLTAGCAGPNQRAYYRDAIAKFHGSEQRLPDSKEVCWLAADLTGSSAGSNVIAEEEFTHFLIKKDLCKVVEKHPDATVGYAWPQADVCPCPAGVQTCQAQCDAKPDASAAGGSPVPGLGAFGAAAGGGKPPPEGHDNNRSNDKLLERHKKSTIPGKLITYRIDELNKERAVIHFRVSNVKKEGDIEQSETVFVYARPAGGSEEAAD
jgi:hypothetical protein